jgi:putative glutamine amidotransferase
LSKGGRELKNPIIGITCSQDDIESNYILRKYYVNVIEYFGGVPVILPAVNNKLIENHINLISGLILSGGGDVDPLYFNKEPNPSCGLITPERDFYEIELIKKYEKTGKPLLAICRGVQVLNIAYGGSIYQDIYSELQKELIKHEQLAPKWYPTHSVEINTESKLYKIFKEKIIRVNSFHHQAVNIPADDFNVTAVSSDGIIEAIEHKNLDWIGVQWHPECMAEKISMQKNIFEYFINYCK